MNIIDVVTYLTSGIYTNFLRLLGKQCAVGYYVINPGVMKLIITVVADSSSDDVCYRA